MRSDKVVESIAQLGKPVGLDFGEIKLVLTVGNLWLPKRDPKSAKEPYDDALISDPAAAEDHVVRGELLLQAGRSVGRGVGVSESHRTGQGYGRDPDRLGREPGRRCEGVVRRSHQEQYFIGAGNTEIQGKVLSKSGKTAEGHTEVRAARAIGKKFPGAEEERKTLVAMR